MPPPQDTPAQRLATLTLGRPVHDWITERRTRRPRPLPWRRIAEELRDVTDGAVDVTGETLRSWMAADPAGSSRAPAA